MNRLPVDLLQSVSLSNMPVQAHHATSSSNVALAAWRRAGLIAALLALSLIGATAALALMKKQYVAEAMMQLNLDKREGGASDERGPPVVLDGNFIIQGELKIMRSRLVVRRVVERLHLADAATIAGGRGHTLLSRVSVAAKDALGIVTQQVSGIFGEPSDMGQRVNPVEDKRDGPTKRLEAAEDDVLSRMTVDSDNRSYLITIKYTADDPDSAAKIANALADEYIQRRLEANFDVAGKTVEWLDAQMVLVKQQLSQAEQSVESYKAQSGLLELGGTENLGQQKLRDLSTQLSTAVVARNDAKSRLSRIQDSGRGATLPADDMKGSPQIKALLDRELDARTRLDVALASVGSRHPQALQAKAALDGIEAALAAERRRGVGIAQAELATAQQNERDVSLRLEALQQAMIVGKAQEGELRSRQAQISGLRDRLATLTRNRDQARDIQQLRPVAASLIVPAERPHEPSSPKPVVVYPAALAGWLGLGLMLATVLERRDRGLLSGADVEPMLGKRCLGMVPEVPHAVLAPMSARKNRRTAFETSVLAESTRAVGAALGLFDVVRACRVVLVTSSVAGEGKSVFCRSLADTLVASGRRVLLVDGSPRRTGNQQVTNEADESPQAAVSDRQIVTMPTGEPNRGLTVLRRSAATSLASDVFGTTELARLVEDARRHFDVVVIEGSPVLLVADSLVLGRLADTVIHVARWSKTQRRTISTALGRLHESGIDVDGIVLTRVNLARHAALRSADLGSHYLKERRFYERLLPSETTHASEPSRGHRT